MVCFDRVYCVLSCCIGFTHCPVLPIVCGAETAGDQPMSALIDFQTDPSRYRHWRVEYDGAVANLILDVDESAGLFEGYELKLSSYGLGVDLELNDIVQRMRFEHPEVRVWSCCPDRNECFRQVPKSACWAGQAIAIRSISANSPTRPAMPMKRRKRKVGRSTSPRSRGPVRAGDLNWRWRATISC